jgi:hypothetical protein
MAMNWFIMLKIIGLKRAISQQPSRLKSSSPPKNQANPDERNTSKTNLGTHMRAIEMSALLQAFFSNS